MEIPQIINGSANDNILLLAHGAGAGMDSAFMNTFSDALVSRGVKVVRFEFPYMEKIRETGKKRPPDKPDVLLKTFYEMVVQWQAQGANVFVGGKSMGGRMATLLLAASDDFDSAVIEKIKGCICLGYPFHPPGKADKTRTSHFLRLSKPVLVVQGENDAFGKKAEIESYVLPNNIQLAYVEGGNHDLKAPKKLGKTHEETIDFAAKCSAQFIADYL